MSEKMQMFRHAISDKLGAIEKMLPEKYRLTLVCRHTLRDDAHIVLTEDDLREAVKAIGKLEPRAMEV